MGLMIGNNKVCIIEKVQVDGTGIPRGISSTGAFSTPLENFSFTLPSSAQDLGDYALAEAFYNCKNLASADLSSLTSISGFYAMDSTFNNTSITSVDFSSLITISGSGALNSTFYYCRGLSSVSFPSLQTISGSALNKSFAYSSISSVSFPSLSVISGSSAMQNAFQSCSSLKTLSFPSLNSNSFGSYTNQFTSMLQGCSNVTVHFPSNLQSVIGSWSSVTNGFGGTNTTVLFDLPSTERVNLTISVIQGLSNLRSFTINNNTYSSSDFSSNLLTIQVPKDTSLSWSAQTSSTSYYCVPSSGTLNLSQDGNLELQIITKGGALY